jgi:hypothetical protein
MRPQHATAAVGDVPERVDLSDATTNRKLIFRLSQRAHRRERDE